MRIFGRTDRPAPVVSAGSGPESTQPSFIFVRENGIDVVMLVIVMLMMCLFVRVQDIFGFLFLLPFHDEPYNVYNCVNCYEKHQLKLQEFAEHVEKF